MQKVVSLFTRVVFGEIDAGYLAVPTCYKMHPVCTVVLNFELLLIFDAPAIGRHKSFKHLSLYLLFVHVGEFLANSFSLFSARFFVGIIPGFIECLGLFPELV